MPYPMGEVPTKLPDSVLKAVRRSPLVAELATLPMILAACETTTNQQLYILSVEAQNISNTPYAQLGQGASDFISQHDKLQTGTSLTVLGISGETSFLVTPVLNRNGLKIATYEDSNGQIQNKVLIPMQGTVPGTQTEYVAFYPVVSDAVSEKILNGEPVTVYNTDIGVGLYALTLKPGLRMEDFQREKDQATTPAQARQILEKYVDTFMIADPNDPVNKQYITKVSGQNDILDSLVGILTGVQPVSAAEITPGVTPMSPTVTFVPTAETPSSTPEPAWMATVKIVDGKPVIDLYDTPAQESIILNQETIKIMQTTDVLYPNILTARGEDGFQYIFNPDTQGWFKVPEVQMDYTKLEQYTPVTVDYFTDGRFALVSALKYAENPTISPDAIIPQFWVNSFHGQPSYGGYSNFVDISMNPHGDLGRAQDQWLNLIRHYTSANKPFAWAGFYKVFYNNGADYFYVIGRTIKTGEKQTQSFAYGLDRANWERARDSIKSYIESIDNGGVDLMMILAPPNDSNFSWNPDLVSSGYGPNPVVAALQQRGELIALFSPEDQETILKVLNQIPTPYSTGYIAPLNTSPINNLPPNLSKYILLPGSG